MGRRRYLVGVVLGVVAISLWIAPKPTVMLADGGCSASNVILGQMPALTGPTTTDWFNVFGENFDPSVPATLTFNVSVIPYSVDLPDSVLPPVTSYTMPAKDMGAFFKWTFRARDENVQKISVSISASGCTASTVVDFSPPATSTVLASPSVHDQSSAELLILLLAFCGGALTAVRRRHHSVA